MKRQRILTSVLTLALLLALTVGLSRAQGPEPLAALGTGFTYQGFLTDGGNPLAGATISDSSCMTPRSGGAS